MRSTLRAHEAISNAINRLQGPQRERLERVLARLDYLMDLGTEIGEWEELAYIKAAREAVRSQEVSG